MKKVTFKYVLDSYVKANGTQSILLRITQNRSKRYVDIGFPIKAEDWNSEKCEVRKSHPLWREIDMVMQNELIKAQRIYLTEISQDRPISARQIKQQLKKELVGDSFLQYADNYVSKMPNPGTRKGRASIISKLKEFLGKGSDGKQKDLLFPEITLGFLKDYERHLKRLGNGKNTIHGNMKFLKTVFKEAVDTEHFQPRSNPYQHFSAPTVKTHRVRLKPFEIEDIENFKIPPGNRRYDAQQVFLFAYYLQGMRASDVIQLKWQNVKGIHVHYKAGKTEKTRPRKLILRAQAILEYYGSEGRQRNDYIFPFLKGLNRKDYNAEEWLKKLDSKNALIRKELKNIANELGLEALSMHVARHSYATNALRATNGNVHLVSDSLDHSSIAITEKYFSAAEPEENDDLVFKVFGE